MPDVYVLAGRRWCRDGTSYSCNDGNGASTVVDRDMMESNPYAASSCDKVHVGENRSTIRRWRGLTLRLQGSLVLSLFAMLHFAVSLCFWSVGVYDQITTNPGSISTGFFSYVFWNASPALALFILSTFSLVRAAGKRRFAFASACLVLVLSIAAFSYDVAHRQPQIKITIASRAFWDSGNSSEVYFTWWWYNDAWFRT